jgi:hypothetical protein
MRVLAGRREYLEMGVLQLYWQLFDSNFLGTGTVLAEENTWRWVSCSCTDSYFTAISLVLAPYWQKRVPGGGSPAAVLAAV